MLKWSGELNNDNSKLSTLHSDVKILDQFKLNS